jgi:hypothetical protein
MQRHIEPWREERLPLLPERLMPSYGILWVVNSEF